jgi:hypothetical protein
MRSIFRSLAEQKFIIKEDNLIEEKTITHRICLRRALFSPEV